MQQRLEIFKGILEPMERGPLVDLGAGHCKFSQIAHDMGFAVTSIDARTDRVPSDLPCPFIQQDVKDADLTPYSIVLILGLLYHLTLEDQVALLAKCAGKTVIVDTHTARSADVNRSGYWGQDWEEVDSPTSSAGNSKSFWHTHASLRSLFADHGFQAEEILPEHAPGRAFWVLKPAA